ncbi:hypothetical protein ACFSM5_10960 [Lacibacterium aquatile]|uniref:Fido domain-containing protein n=1 Tax=Lacibacterium aquatile TaxID=1168082 RepID=A0ABW5DSN0_9PROT
MAAAEIEALDVRSRTVVITLVSSKAELTTIQLRNRLAKDGDEISQPTMSRLLTRLIKMRFVKRQGTTNGATYTASRLAKTRVSEYQKLNRQIELDARSVAPQSPPPRPSAPPPVPSLPPRVTTDSEQDFIRESVKREVAIIEMIRAEKTQKAEEERLRSEERARSHRYVRFYVKQRSRPMFMIDDDTFLNPAMNWFPDEIRPYDGALKDVSPKDFEDIRLSLIADECWNIHQGMFEGLTQEVVEEAIRQSRKNYRISDELYLRLVNYKEASLYAFSAVSPGEPITPSMLLGAHEILLRGLPEAGHGQFRTHPEEQIERFIDKHLRFVHSRAESAFQRAFIVYFALCYLRPLSSGGEVIARMFSNAILLSERRPPILFQGFDLDDFWIDICRAGRMPWNRPEKAAALFTSAYHATYARWLTKTQAPKKIEARWGG